MVGFWPAAVWDNTVKLWDWKSGQELTTLRGTPGYVPALAFSPDSQTLAFDSEDNTIKLWDRKSGKLFATLEGHRGNVTAVAFSPNGRMLASGSRDNNVKLWDWKSRRELNDVTRTRGIRLFGGLLAGRPHVGQWQLGQDGQIVGLEVGSGTCYVERA